MTTTTANTTVVIVGAGVAGLTLGNFLQLNGIGCIIVERRSREYVEQRQRAGTIDARGVQMFREWGIDEVIEAHSHTENASGFWIDGEELPIEFDEDDNGESVFCPQQVLVRNLTNLFLRGGGDIRYEALDVTLSDLDGIHPTLRYQDDAGSTKLLRGEFIAGCDGDRGVSRASIPAGALTRYSHEFEYSWLSVLARVPTDPSGMAIHARGLAGMIPRGVEHTRIYLQCRAGESPQGGPEERIWTELEARFGRPVSTGPIIDKQLVPLRSVVHSPMSHGRLHLLGDAAHIVPPMSAKGIHLALFDAETFARAVIRQVRKDDPSLLESYSETCLAHVWNYQAFATWITEIMHNAGGPHLRRRIP